MRCRLRLSGKIFAFNASRVKSTLTARRFPDDGNRLAGAARSHAAPEARLREGAAADQTETEQSGSQQHQGHRLRHRNRPGHEQVGQVIGIARIQQTWTDAEHLLPGQQVRGVRVQDIVGIRVPFRVRRDDDFAELTARVVAALDRLDLPCVCRSRDTRGKQAAGKITSPARCTTGFLARLSAVSATLLMSLPSQTVRPFSGRSSSAKATVEG